MDATRVAAGGTGQRAMRADARRNYERLLATASAVFTERDADDASLEEIARRAGVGIGTLYRHFPSRQVLLEAVYRDQVTALCARAEELAGTEPPGQALTRWLRAMVDFGKTKRSLTSAMLSTLDKDSELVSTCSGLIRDAASALLVRAQRAGEVRADAQVSDLIRLAHAVSMVAERDPADSGQADRLLTLVADGLRPQPSAD
jgi:AcrR family transcriptional regulator